MMTTLESGIRELQDDHTNGARILATNALYILRSLIVQQTTNDPSKLWQYLCLCGWRLSCARPSMDAAIRGALVEALYAVEKMWEEHRFTSVSDEHKDDMLSTSALRNLARKGIEDTIEQRTKRAGLLANEFTKWIEAKAKGVERPLRILTLSYSSSMKICMQDALASLPNLMLDLRILESRPGCEGASLAAALQEGHLGRSIDLSIQVETDSSVALLAKDIDILLLGADRISSSGDVSNKTGSLAAAICTKILSPTAEVIIVSETDKIAVPGAMEEQKEENNDSEEVSGLWKIDGSVKGKVKTSNIYFEWVEEKWIDGFICEKGCISKDDIRKVAEEREAREREVFGNYMS